MLDTLVLMGIFQTLDKRSRRYFAPSVTGTTRADGPRKRSLGWAPDRRLYARDPVFVRGCYVRTMHRRPGSSLRSSSIDTRASNGGSAGWGQAPVGVRRQSVIVVRNSVATRAT